MDKFCRIITAPGNAEEIRAALEPLGYTVDFAPGDPLAGVVSADALDEPVRTFLGRNGIASAADLGRLRLDDLAAAPGVTRQALTRFVRELARSERYPDAAALQDFLVRRGIFI
ncbi:MAG TPA: hypothetical protein VGF28_19775 [Thermoanaerobaculia bacterium]